MRLKTESETGFFSLASKALRACEARALRARTTLTPRFTDFFTDFEKKTDCFAVYMSCNTSKCKELCMSRKGVTPNFPPLCGIEQTDSLTLLGVTLQNAGKFLSGSKQVFVHFKITKKRWIYAGRDRSSL